MNKIKIPDTWKWVTLNDIGIVVTGNTPSKKTPEYYGNEIPFYKPTDLEQGINVIEAREYLSYEAQYLARIVPENSVLVTSIGSTIGKSGMLKKEGAFNQQINAIVPFINPKYIYYYITSKQFSEELLNKSSATTIPIINKSKFETISFPLAPIEEQNRIVEKIEELFSELDKSNSELINSKKTTENLKNLIVYKAFKKNYSFQNLSDVSEIIMGQSPSSKTYNINNQGLPLFQGKKEFTDFYPIPEKWTTNPIRIAKKKDVLISVRAPVGDVNIANINCSIGRGLASIRFKGYYKFLFYYLKSIKYDINNLGTGTTFNSISKSIVSNLKVPYPEESIQIEVINDLEIKLSNFEKVNKDINEQIINTKILKDKILTEIFQGKLTQQFSSDSSVDFLLENIQIEKSIYNKQLDILQKKRKKESVSNKKELDLLNFINQNYTNSSFLYSEIYDRLNISKEELIKKFKILEHNKIIEGFFDKKSETIKYRLL